ncbi:MAG: immunoglobulin domain-containing protein [Verrucomicrobiota bacterium]
MPARLIALFLTAISAQADVLLDDSWADATRSDTALTAESAWHASSSASLTAAAGSLTGTTASGSSRSWWTHFTENPAVPVSLLQGETLKVTLRFTPVGVNATNSSRALRIGLFDFSGGTRTTADNSSPAGEGVAGYALNMNFGQTFGVAGPISIRERTTVSSSDLMGSAGDFTTLPDGDGGAADGSPGFVSGALHTLEWSITRTTAGAEITATFSRSDGWSITHTATDDSPVVDFDGFALRPANSAQTATSFVFSRITVEKLNAVPPGPPIVGTHPQGQSMPAGSDVILSADAAGLPPITWQWRRNGTDLPGDTATTLTLTNLQLGGTYTALATNPYGSTESDPALLTVTPQAPVFTLHPESVAAISGSTVTFTATARGTDPIAWQWTRNGAPVDGATTSSLTLTNVQPSAVGSYRVTATNTVDDTSSDAASLTITTVAAPPGIYVAPGGTAAAPGTIAQPTTLAEAVTRIAPGGIIYLRGGTYNYNTQVTIARGNNGTSDLLRKSILAFTPANGIPEEPVLDFSSQPYGSTSSVSNPRGIMLGGDWWHFRGLTIKGAADNGIYVAGNQNIIELCRTHSCRDSGLQISRYQSSDGPALWPSFNLILNCESWDNYDTPPNGGENADGFACKLTSGDGNVFRGCIAHHNIDDGWDLFTKTETGPIGSVVIDRCIAHNNGTLTDGTSNSNGDRNGFKLGGSDMPVVHTVTRSMAYSNGKNGITWNSNPAAIRLVGNLCFNNAQGNFKFDQPGPVFFNNASLYTTVSGVNDRYGGSSGAPTGANCFWYVGSSSRGPSINDGGITISAASFQNLTPPLTWPRNADGSIDFGNFARPIAGHGVINGGVLPPGITLPYDTSYYEGTPDIGLVEYRAGWQLWREQQFGEDSLSQPHTSASSLSPDGQPNALHYLVGLDAGTAIPTALLPKMTNAGSFRWFRETSAIDMTAIPYTSTTLNGWSPLGTQLINTAGQMQEWQAILPTVPGSQRYFRLGLTPN